jgi:hypothetical protein
MLCLTPFREAAFFPVSAAIHSSLGTKSTQGEIYAF